MALRHWPMKSLSPWHTNAAVCASAFIKPAEIRQSSPRTDLGREHSKYVFLAKPLQSSSFSENKKYMTQSTDKLSASHSEEHMLGHGFYNKHSHEQAKANTYALPLIVEAINRIDLAQIGGDSESPITARRRDKIRFCQ